MLPSYRDKLEELERSVNEMQDTLIDLMLLDKPDNLNQSVYSMSYDEYVSLKNKL